MTQDESINPSETDAVTPIAAFDFDGTLTVRDSFTAFLAWRAGKLGYVAGFARLAPDLIAYLGARDRGKLKAAAVGVYLSGVPRADLAAAAARFAETMAPALFRPDALATWRLWGERGARRVIVTASPELTVAPFAAMLGADDLIGTRLTFDAQDRVTGAFEGSNCRGPEKVARLRERFGEDVRLAAAYGDTGGDAEMLQLAAERGYRVFTGTPTRA